MDDQPQLKTTDLLRDSFAYAKERIPEILSSQILYFVLLLPIAIAMAYGIVDVMGHVTQINAMQAVEEAVKKAGGKPDMTLINEEVGKLFWPNIKLMLCSLLYYFFCKSFVNKLYDGLSKGTTFPRFTIFPIARNVWRLMGFDLNVMTRIVIHMLIIVAIAFVGLLLSIVLKSQSLNLVFIIPLIGYALYVFYLFVCHCPILFAAQPSVYEHQPIKLMKHYYPATKGYRWKIWVTKTGVAMPMVIVNTALSHFFNGKEEMLDLHSMLIEQVLVTLFVAIWMIWDVYLNVLLWQRIAPKARELAATPAA